MCKCYTITYMSLTQTDLNTLQIMIEKIVNGAIQKSESQINSKFEAIDRRFDTIDKKFDSIDRKFADIDKRFDSLEQRIDTLEQRFDNLERRMDSLEQRFANLEQRMDSLEQRFANLEQRIEGLEKRMDRLELRMEEGFEAIDARFDRLVPDLIAEIYERHPTEEEFTVLQKRFDDHERGHGVIK